MTGLATGGHGVGEKRNYGGYRFSPLLLHRGNCQQQLHYPVVYILVVKTFYYKHILPPYRIQYLNACFPVLEFGAV